MMRQRRKKPGNISAWRAKKLNYVALRRQLKSQGVGEIKKAHPEMGQG